MQATDFTIKNGSKTRVQFIKYHEVADQQPLSKKGREKLGIFPSLALPRWQPGFVRMDLMSI